MAAYPTSSKYHRVCCILNLKYFSDLKVTYKQEEERPNSVTQSIQSNIMQCPLPTHISCCHGDQAEELLVWHQGIRGQLVLPRILCIALISLTSLSSVSASQLWLFSMTQLYVSSNFLKQRAVK